ncbi:hypothetical protein [Pseudothauera nasutitermitis]|nr:hypothetical protein [Pseudothauera nasutitermitis]
MLFKLTVFGLILLAIGVLSTRGYRAALRAHEHARERAGEEASRE